MAKTKHTTVINTGTVISIKKESRQPKPQSSTLGNLAPHPQDFKSLKTLSNSYHNKAIHFKATCAVGLGFDLFDQKNEPIQEPPDFFTRANPLESFQEVLLQVALDFEETGNAYMEIVRNAKGEPAEAYWTPSETVYISKDKSRYVQKVDSKEQPFTPYGAQRRNKDTSELIRFKYPSNRSTYYGIPDWLGCVGSILLDSYAVEWNYRFFENNAIPSFAIIVEGGEFSSKVEKTIRDFLAQNLKGLSNAHRTLYLPIKNRDVKVRFEEIMKRPAEGEFQKLREQIRDEILSAHGVPPRLMGVVAPGSLGGAGEAQQQLKIFKEILIAPKQRQFEAILNTTILKDFNLSVKFHEIDITPQKDDVQEITQLVQTQILTPEEGRERLNLPTLKSEKEALNLLKQIITLREALKKLQ